MADHTESLWARYRGEGDLHARRELLDRYLGLVHHCACEVHRRFAGSVERDELVSAGTIGLVQALEGFDPSRGLAFSTYAVPRIRGAMLDELRAQDWMSRTARARKRRLEKMRAALAQRLGRAPTVEETAEVLGVDTATVHRWAGEADGSAFVFVDGPEGDQGEDATRAWELVPDPDGEEPGAALVKDETLRELFAAMMSLPPKERLVLVLYYYEELGLRQIGEVLHVSESRVSQIRSRALRRLRERASLVVEGA